jgi:hypothetical protein
MNSPIVRIIPVPWSYSSVDSWPTSLHERGERFALSALFLEVPIIIYSFSASLCHQPEYVSDENALHGFPVAFIGIFSKKTT